jgi:hypothetical protein
MKPFLIWLCSSLCDSEVMNSVPLTHEEIFSKVGDDFKLDAIVLYDDIPSGERAIRVVSDALARAGNRSELRPHSWSFDLLDDPDWIQTALREASQSDLIVVSTRGSLPLPESLQRYLEQTMRESGGRNRALVALLGPDHHPDGPDSARWQFLHHITSEAGAHFLAPNLNLGCSESSLTIPALDHRAATVTPTLDQILQQPGTLPAAPLPRPHTD